MLKAVRKEMQRLVVAANTVRRNGHGSQEEWSAWEEAGLVSSLMQ